MATPAHPGYYPGKNHPKASRPNNLYGSRVSLLVSTWGRVGDCYWLFVSWKQFIAAGG